MGVDQIGIRMGTTEILQGLAADDGALWRPKHLFQDMPGIGAGDGIHGVHADPGP